MRKIKDGVRYWGQLFLLPIYVLGRIIPRNKKIWLFGSTFGNRYADNPRYLFQYCSQKKMELGIRPIWISRKHDIVEHLRKNGCESYYYHSLKGIWYALRGKVYIYDNYSKDINFWQSAGSVKINMWHGIPLKKIQADNIHDYYRNPRNWWERWTNIPRNISDEKPRDYVLTTSENLVEIFSSAFRTRNVLTSGYARTDYLISDEINNLLLPVEQIEEKEVLDFLYSKNSGKIVYYMPTFRDSEVKFFEVMDLDLFQIFLEKNHILFCIKLHPKSKLRKEFAKISYRNIKIVHADSDPYVILKKTDVLVTDYSSIYFDFLLLDRPIVFFDYDLAEYLTKSREMYFEYEKVTPGEKAKDMKVLMEAILRGISEDKAYHSEYKEYRKKIKKRMFDNSENVSSQRLFQDICTILKS